jgi:hypothetical protein
MLSSRRSKAIAPSLPGVEDLADLCSATGPDTHGRSGNIGSLSLKLSLLAATMKLNHGRTSYVWQAGSAWDQEFGNQRLPTIVVYQSMKL